MIYLLCWLDYEIRSSIQSLDFIQKPYCFQPGYLSIVDLLNFYFTKLINKYMSKNSENFVHFAPGMTIFCNKIKIKKKNVIFQTLLSRCINFEAPQCRPRHKNVLSSIYNKIIHSLALSLNSIFKHKFSKTLKLNRIGICIEIGTCDSAINNRRILSEREFLTSIL